MVGWSDPARVNDKDWNIILDKKKIMPHYKLRVSKFLKLMDLIMWRLIICQWYIDSDFAYNIFIYYILNLLLITHRVCFPSDDGEY